MAGVEKPGRPHGKLLTAGTKRTVDFFKPNLPACIYAVGYFMAFMCVFYVW